MHRTLPLSVRCGAVRQTALTGRRNSIPVASGEVRPVLTRRHLKHRTLKPASGAHRPVRCQNANLSAHESGGHRTRPAPHKERPTNPRRAHKARAQRVSRAVFFLLSRFSPSRPCPSPQEPPPTAEIPPPAIPCHLPCARSAQGSLPHPSPHAQIHLEGI
jgi:hypothetical protein